MTTIDELSPPSNSLKAEDLEGEETTLVIKSYTVREFDQEKDGRHYTVKKPIFSFKDTDKTLVCNKTNMQAIAYAYGKEMDAWIGKKITLFPTMVPFGDKMVEAIRVRVVKPGKKQPKFVQSENPAEDMSDPMPF
jgi:hypothetical protein